MDQIVLFGDSLTMQSADPSKGFNFTAELQFAYIRRLDVVNRGYSGYNTDQALQILPHIIKSPACGRIRILNLFFGANDARLPNTGEPAQHVPLATYKANLVKIMEHASVAPHFPKFVLITPPPVDERNTLKAGSVAGYADPILLRKAAVTAKYAQAVRDLGREREEVLVVDLWTELMRKAGWDGDHSKPLPGSMEAPVNDVLQRLLPDGLHFSGETYKILFQLWKKSVVSKWPDYEPASLGMVLPAWGDVEAWKHFKGPGTYF